MMKLQKVYNRKVVGENLSQKEIERCTQELALCAHAEISSLVNATNYKPHHGKSIPEQNRDSILFESVDVIRYMIAIMNTWDINSKEFISAFNQKNTYLDMLNEFKDNPWDGERPVAIIDIDDVLAEFRLGFSTWLNCTHNIYPDIESKEYYFITALAEADINPETIFEQFMAESGFLYLEPAEGAQEMISELKARGYWIQLLTARPREELRCLYDTFYWLRRHLFSADAIDFSAEKFRWCAKSKYYDKGKIAFAIDDSPKHAKEYVNHGIKCFVPKKSYNENLEHKDITFYDGFNDFLSKI
jgi:hypothetical protein